MRAILFLIYPLFLIYTNLHHVHSLNILGVFPYEGKSHFFVFQTYLEELAARGHNLTVISCFPREKPIKNYHDISLADKVQVLEDAFPLKRSYYTIYQISMFLMSSGMDSCKRLVSDENVQNLVKSKAKFDLVITEQFNSDCGLGLAYKLGAPVIGMTTHVLMPWQYNRFGVPYNPSFVTFGFLEGGTKPTLYQRVERTVFDFYFKMIYKLLGQKTDQNTFTKYFGDIPPLEDLGREIKFLLSYTYFVLSGPNLLPPNIIEVNGYHVAKPKTLPDNLKKFIEESEHGVIYISFGSVIKAASAPRDLVETITAALSELPQRVIWKWEENTLPGMNPKNIYLSKWLPQNEILVKFWNKKCLDKRTDFKTKNETSASSTSSISTTEIAHPKLVAFYSHCGLLGTTEAIYHGVPMVAMPVFGEQPANAAAVEESGFGVQIPLNELTKNNLLEKFRTVLDPKFRERVKMVSKAWHDRPLSAMDTAIYWTEFAATHKNFTFRAPAADVPLYQYLCLDILAVYFIAFIVFIVILKSLLSLLFSSKSKVKTS